MARKHEELVDMDRTDVLAFVESRHAARLQAERDILDAARHWAELHSPDGLAASGVTEHVAASFAARIQTSPYGAKRLIADAMDIHHRLPRLSAGLEAGTVRVAHARHVASATRDLSPEEAAWVDAEVVESADGRLGWTRFDALVAGKVAAAAPEAAAAKERAAALEHGVRMSRVNAHGTATLTVRGEAATIMALEHTARTGAKELESSMPDATVGQRQVAALVHAAGARTPRVKVYLHLAPDSPIARMEGHGAVTTTYVRHLLARITGGSGTVRVAPVIDLADQAPVDAYEIPARLREAVHLLHPGDVFPFAAHTSRRVDLDHQHPYGEGGPTALENLGPLTRTHHRIKTHAGWDVRQPFPGIIVWRDPHGAHYLVDQTGTRKTTGSVQQPGGREATPLELHTTRILLDYVA